MAVAKGRSTDTAEYKRYIGVAPVFINAVNPTKKELEGFYNTTIDNEPKYLGEVEVNDKKIPNVRIDFIVTTDETVVGTALRTKISFFIRNEYRYNRDRTKVQVIDKYGRTAWVTIEQAKNHEIPTYSNGPANLDKDYRPAYTGEEDVTNFIKTFLGIPNPEKWVKNEETGKREVVGLVDNPQDCECRLENIEDYFKGKFTELKDAINLMPNNKVKVLFGVRTTDDNKQYQDVYTKMFLSNATSNYDKISKDLQDRKDNGSYPNTEFVVADLQEYEIKATNFNNSNNGGNDGEMPFDAEAPASTDWFSGN